jgi:hypothetical protein
MLTVQKIVERRQLRAISLLACLAAAYLLPGTVFGLSQAELDTERSQWNSQGLTDYHYVVDQECFCFTTGPAVVSVRSGAVVAGVPYSSFYDSPFYYNSQFYASVNDLFDYLQSAINYPAYSLSAQFDPTFGYPSSLYIKYYQFGADDEINITVNNLVPLGPGTLLGDYNRNDLVDAADYTVWRDSRGLTAIDLVADGDGSGSVDGFDYKLWQANFGQQFNSGGGASSSVPEPSAMIQAIIAMVALLVNAARFARPLLQLPLT